MPSHLQPVANYHVLCVGTRIDFPQRADLLAKPANLCIPIVEDQVIKLLIFKIRSTLS